MKTLITWLRRWGPSLLMMALIFTASSMPGTELPHFGIWDLDLKKGAHMLGYALLGASFMHGLTNPAGSVRRLILLATVLAGLYAMSDEFHQSFTTARTSSWMDVGIDTAGAALGAWIWVRIKSMLPA
jgi:VanZ family protein